MSVVTIEIHCTPFLTILRPVYLMRHVGLASAVHLERAIALAQKLKPRLLLASSEMAIFGMAQQLNRRLLLASREMMVVGLEDTVLVARTIQSEDIDVQAGHVDRVVQLSGVLVILL